MEVNLTENQIIELYKCYMSPVYFITNYCWIEVKETGEIIPFKIFDYQEKILQWLIEKKSGLVLKSRRVGASTIVAAYAAWLTNFRRGVKVLFISRNEDAAKLLLGKVKFNLRNMAYHDNNKFSLASNASWLLNEIVVDNQQLLSVGWRNDDGSLASMSEVASLTTTSESGRGDSATFIFMDEVAFLQDQENTARSARLTTTRGGYWLGVSTPNGVGDYFHSMCMRAERGENESYEFLKVHWSEAGMTNEMIRRATEGLSMGSRLQEMELEFLSTGDPVFNHIHLAACYKPIDDYPEVYRDLSIYRDRVDKGNGDFYYYSGVDTAIGKLSKKDSKRDYHSFTALTKSGIQAATFHSKEMPLSEWAGSVDEMDSIGMVYQEGLVSQLHRAWPGLMQIEDNGPGVMVVNHHKLPEDHYSSVSVVSTTHKLKRGLIEQLVLAVESHSIVITDRFTYQCMSVFQRGITPGTYSAPQGDYYDDPVISLALAYDGLLRSGGMEFSWGFTADDLHRKVLSDDDVERANIEKIPYGPTLFKEAGPTDRLSNLEPDESILINQTADLDIDRIGAPESVGYYDSR